MLNVNYKVTGSTLTIVVDLSERHGQSASGKTIIIASTQGNQKVGDKFPEVSFGLNVYTKAPK